jgi:phosphinothricin acetyltransferase
VLNKSGGETLIIRSANEYDLPAIIEIYNSTIPSKMVTADTSPVTVESKLAWFHEHNAANRPIWVAEDHEKVSGWLSFSSFYNRPAYDCTAEVSIYIAEQYRGKGVGAELLSKAIKESPKIGIKNILGFIFELNEPSLKLFDKFNFKQ